MPVALYLMVLVAVIAAGGLTVALLTSAPAPLLWASIAALVASLLLLLLRTRRS